MSRTLFWLFQSPFLAFTAVNLVLAGPIWVISKVLERNGPSKAEQEAERRAHLGDFYW